MEFENNSHSPLRHLHITIITEIHAFLPAVTAAELLNDLKNNATRTQANVVIFDFFVFYNNL